MEKKGFKMQDIYAVRLFKFGNFFEIRTYESYEKALEFATANLTTSDWDIKQVQQ